MPFKVDSPVTPKVLPSVVAPLTPSVPPVDRFPPVIVPLASRVVTPDIAPAFVIPSPPLSMPFKVESPVTPKVLPRAVAPVTLKSPLLVVVVPPTIKLLVTVDAPPPPLSVVAFIVVDWASEIIVLIGSDEPLLSVRIKLPVPSSSSSIIIVTSLFALILPLSNVLVSAFALKPVMEVAVTYEDENMTITVTDAIRYFKDVVRHIIHILLFLNLRDDFLFNHDSSTARGHEENFYLSAVEQNDIFLKHVDAL